MLKDQSNMRSDIRNLQESQEVMQERSDKRHRETMDQLHLIRADQNHTRENVVRNERKIAILESKASI